MKKLHVTFWAVAALALVWLALAGCAGATQRPPASEPAPPTPEATITATAYRGLCAYVWSEQRMAELEEPLSTALEKAMLERSEAVVTAYGESCVDSSTNVVVSFSPQELNYTVATRAQDVSDAHELGNRLAQVVLVIADFQARQAPGGKAGRVEVSFQDASRSAEASFPLLYGVDLVERGVKGSELFEQLAVP